MRTTVTLDDELIAEAREYTGILETTAIIQKALKTLVELEASRRMALLGGSDPGAKAAPRRQTEPVNDPG